jgi:ABC-type molybdenum transport system ATPase subunit/photorepair protein PhrA
MQMPKYEIWGEDDTGKTGVLGYVTGELPETGDTMVVRGFVREVGKVWRHHVGTQASQRVGVGKPTGEAEGV